MFSEIISKTGFVRKWYEVLKIGTESIINRIFAEDATVRLFNSDMVLYYLKNYEDIGKGPKDLIDKNIASDYSKLGNMFELRNKSQNMKVLDKILKGEEIRCSLTSQFSMEKDFDEDDFKSLLFYLGMLTIEKERLNRVVLKVPNYVIKELYFDFFMKKLNESIDYEIDTIEVKEALEEIALDGRDESLVKIVEKTLHKPSPKILCSI